MDELDEGDVGIGGGRRRGKGREGDADGRGEDELDKFLKTVGESCDLLCGWRCHFQGV